MQNLDSNWFNNHMKFKLIKNILLYWTNYSIYVLLVGFSDVLLVG